MPSIKYKDKFQQYNKVAYANQQQKFHECECKSIILKVSLVKHLKSDKHKILLERIEKMNKPLEKIIWYPIKTEFDLTPIKEYMDIEFGVDTTLETKIKYKNSGKGDNMCIDIYDKDQLISRLYCNTDTYDYDYNIDTQTLNNNKFMVPIDITTELYKYALSIR